jgi:hypothetical protein
MTREQLEHAIRAACDVANDTEVYVFGSQAILGQYPEAPAALRQSVEADIAPVHAIDMLTMIDGNLGRALSIPRDSRLLHSRGWTGSRDSARRLAGTRDTRSEQKYTPKHRLVRRSARLGSE